MVWGGFSYDKKGPLHIWSPEFAQQKREAQREIDALDQDREPLRKSEWDLETSLVRMNLRNGLIPGEKPKW
jgi:hypothetical protein